MSQKIKVILMMFVLVVFCANLSGQYTYNDAVELAKKGEVVNESGKVVLKLDKEILKILAMYDASLMNTPQSSNAVTVYLNNPFIELQLDSNGTTFSIPVEDLPQSLKAGIDKRSTAAASITGLIDTTTLVSGLSKVLVKRVKEELSVAFFKRFQKLIDGKKFEIFGVLFPETKKILGTINEDIYKFSLFIQSLREAFEKDLSNIYSVLPKALEKLKITEGSNIGKILIPALGIINAIKQDKYPADILFCEETSNFLHAVGAKEFNEFHSVLKFISNSLRDKNNNDHWVEWESFEVLINNSIMRKLFLGLMWQKCPNIKIGEMEFRTILTKVNDSNIDKVKTNINFFVSKIKLLETYRLELKNKKAKGENPTYNDYYKFFREVLDSVEYSVFFIEYVTKKNNLPEDVQTIINDINNANGKNNAHSEFNKAIAYIRIAGDIYLDANQRNYGSLIFDVVRLLDEAMGTEDHKYKKIRGKLMQYGAFIAALAKAENSGNVADLIESVILPAGSWSIKKNSNFNIALNAYVGGSLSLSPYKEIPIQTSSSDQVNPDTHHIKVWAPVGLSLSKGKISNKSIGKVIKSVSLFFSVIDLGAVTSYQFKENEKEIPKITLKNIVSPGIHAIFGINSLPLSFGVGWQREPQLTSISKDVAGETVTVINMDNVWKWNVFIAVDIPLLNFFTK